MIARRCVALLSALFALAPSVYTQINSRNLAAQINAKYGPPLARRTFKVKVGEMVVDYGRNGAVYQITLPPFGPDGEHPGVGTNKAVDDFVLELVPLNMRGKELVRSSGGSGLLQTSVIGYENVSIFEPRQGSERTGVTISFTGKNCRDQPNR
jgi:hypothetical protein